jgi:cytochrome c oxidase accessory protein FixG
VTSSPRTGPGAAAAAAEPSVQVISLYQKQEKIQPRTVQGWFQSWRWAFVWLTQAVFYGGAWLPWNGRQAVLFDLSARRFYIFDLVLYPQDFIYLTGLLILSAYALFLFTAVAGRLWCGYTCPQTVYTEMFMWIERRVEGDRSARIKRDKGAWTGDKLLRKSLKHALWITLALWTGFTFVGYFTPIRELWAQSFTLDFSPWEWFWVLFYGFATYGNAGFMREQVCKYMCPYARFQSAMFDKDTLIVTYDAHRGEPRGTRGRGDDLQQKGLGSCIDCGLCVQVCPTGIDIRKGLQYECIGCAACIDVCNTVMDKMHYPRGLVRYDTENHLAQLAQGEAAGAVRSPWRAVLRPRVLVYSAIMLVLVAAMAASLWMRSPFRVDVIRDRNALARQVEDGAIENVYRLQVMNATEAALPVTVTVSGLPGLTLVLPPTAPIGPAEARWVVANVRLPAEALSAVAAGSHRVEFAVTGRSGAREPVTVREPSTFIIPR